MMRLKNSGFTLVELFVVMALISILAAIAFPNFSSWISNYRIKGATHEIFSHFHLAKLTAIKQNTLCTISFRKSGSKITGYSVYVDSNSNFIHDGTEEIIADVNGEEKYKEEVSYSTNFPDTSGLPSVAFRANGLPVKLLSTGGKVTGNGTITITSSISNRENQVIVNTVGNIRIKKIK